MIQVTPQMRVLVASSAVDFRKGIDGLVQVCRAELLADPFSGALFVFRSRSEKCIKILVYDGQGFWLCQKRLSRGHFRYWPSCNAAEAGRELAAHELSVLLAGGDPEAAPGAGQWRALHNT
jgi:transposase